MLFLLWFSTTAGEGRLWERLSIYLIKVNFNHGLGIYIRILLLASAREKIIEYKCPLTEHKYTAAMNYFLINSDAKIDIFY
jgi:hypothetical protein